MNRWLCANCGSFRPRFETEGPRVGRDAGNQAAWTCRACGATGDFVPESSPEGARIARKFSVETYQDELEAAGFSLEWPNTPLATGLNKGKEFASRGFEPLLKRIAALFRRNR